MGKGMDGRAGKDLVVKVPCGTLVWKLHSPTIPAYQEPPAAEEPQASVPIQTSAASRPILRYQGSERALEIDLSQEDDADEAQGAESAPLVKGYAAISRSPAMTGAELVVDLTHHDQRHVLCKGGRGGLGNRNFATARRQAPRFAQPGESGDEGDFLFELRLIADVGLVGYPNAGKSTLLAAISKARPKIASYPFTTLRPQVGIVEYPDWHRLTVCDVPGLIEGAHQNVGLGHAFLRHIRRCKILVILIDMAGTDGRLPWEDYRQLLRELELYDPALPTKRRLVVANKMDEPIAAENLKKFKRHIRKTPLIPISAAFDEGVDAFKETMREAVAKVS
jgi:GTPase